MPSSECYSSKSYVARLDFSEIGKSCKGLYPKITRVDFSLLKVKSTVVILGYRPLHDLAISLNSSLAT